MTHIALDIWTAKIKEKQGRGKSHKGAPTEGGNKLRPFTKEREREKERAKAYSIMLEGGKEQCGAKCVTPEAQRPKRVNRTFSRSKKTIFIFNINTHKIISNQTALHRVRTNMKN